MAGVFALSNREMKWRTIKSKEKQYKFWGLGGPCESVSIRGHESAPLEQAQSEGP